MQPQMRAANLIIKQKGLERVWLQALAGRQTTKLHLCELRATDLKKQKSLERVWLQALASRQTTKEPIFKCGQLT